MSKHHKGHHSDHSGAHAAGTAYHEAHANTVADGNARGNQVDMSQGSASLGAGGPPAAPAPGGGMAEPGGM